MALKSTIHRLELDVADIDHGNYGSFSLTLARHPSETEERLMMRVLAFALHADPALEFGRGLSSEDEPDLWLKDPTGAISLWIDVGLPEERRLRRAAGRAERIVVIAYGGRGVDVWWDKIRETLARLPALTVLAIPCEAGRALAALADRAMRLQCTVQEQQVYVNDAARSVLIEPVVLRAQ
ncbi:MAG: YaeQ family protein [Gammaproteobacteria bacterium]|nr:YaeQ family protein [Gammaproteobacteria bacterium]